MCEGAEEFSSIDADPGGVRFHLCGHLDSSLRTACHEWEVDMTLWLRRPNHSCLDSVFIMKKLWVPSTRRWSVYCHLWCLVNSNCCTGRNLKNIPHVSFSANWRLFIDCSIYDTAEFNYLVPLLLPLAQIGLTGTVAPPILRHIVIHWAMLQILCYIDKILCHFFHVLCHTVLPNSVPYW